ncbi:MAG: F0F1 ATP synthase subunit gamma [Prevotella sp.]
MPSLKEIKNRIASVNNTRKITSAMKMVASSKLHHAQVMIENMIPYEGMLEHILKTFIASDSDIKYHLDLGLEHSETKHVAIIVFSSNSSLCGGFNANIIKIMQNTVEDYTAQGVSVTIYPIGKKIAEKAVKLGYKIAGDFNALADKPNANDCQAIGRELRAQFLKGELNRVELLYHHFKSAGTQILTHKQLLPIDIEEAMNYDHYRDLESNIATEKTINYQRAKDKKRVEEYEYKAGHSLNSNFIVEPNLETILNALIPRYVNLMIYTALLDSNASEHAARMVAMQTATDNADELLRQLSLQYNKSRQQAITSELLDIVGGSVNN